MKSPSTPPIACNEADLDANLPKQLTANVVQLLKVGPAARALGLSVATMKRRAAEFGATRNEAGEYLFDLSYARTRAAQIVQRGKRDDGAIEAAVFVALAEGCSLFDIIVDFQLGAETVERIAARYERITGGKLNGAPLRRRRKGRLEQFRNGQFSPGREYMVPTPDGEERRFIFDGEEIPEGARLPNDQDVPPIPEEKT